MEPRMWVEPAPQRHYIGLCHIVRQRGIVRGSSLAPWSRPVAGALAGGVEWWALPASRVRRGPVSICTCCGHARSQGAMIAWHAIFLRVISSTSA
jgi:hypothetical protein